jgi:hypothetical protein
VGLKLQSAAIQPTMDMNTLAKTINRQTDIKVANLDIIYQEVYHTHKRWPHLPTAPYTVTKAEAILKNMMSRVHMYEARMVDMGVFQVVYTPMTKEDRINEIPIPLFSRIRTLRVVTDRNMWCICCQFERQGLTYLHQTSVATLCYKSIG